MDSGLETEGLPLTKNSFGGVDGVVAGAEVRSLVGFLSSWGLLEE